MQQLIMRMMKTQNRIYFAIVAWPDVYAHICNKLDLMTLETIKFAYFAVK